jgi:MOSC domain-containing protein YiiM
MKEHLAKVEATLVAKIKTTFQTKRESPIKIELAGIPFDRHYGLLRPADMRQKMYDRGVLIANRRQITIVSLEECDQIADQMGLPHILPEWLGANIAIRGFAKLSHLPQGVRLIFTDGTGLICEGENQPCMGPAKMIEAHYQIPKLRELFIPAARKRRGIVCSVEREGEVREGDAVTIISRGP